MGSSGKMQHHPRCPAVAVDISDMGPCECIYYGGKSEGASMDLICTHCDGLGEVRRPKSSFQPQSNVAGWHRGPTNATGWDCDYYWRRCDTCDGGGFRPSGTSVPTIKREPPA